jgi:RHS repeat-associated protein
VITCSRVRDLTSVCSELSTRGRLRRSGWRRRPLAWRVALVALCVLVALVLVGTAAATVPVNIALPSVSGVFQEGQTLTASTGDWLGSNLSYTYQWQRCTSYQATVLQDSPAGYWRLGERSGLSAADASGHGLTGSYLNAITLGAQGALSGDPDTAVSLDGADDSVSVPDAAALHVADTFTLEAWITLGQSSSQAIVGKGTNGYVLRVTSAGLLTLDKEGTGVIASATTAISTASWHYVAATKSGSSVHLYLDGNDVTGSVTNQTIVDTTSALSIGGPSSAGSYLKGSIDEVALYAAALTGPRIVAHNAAGSSPTGADPCTDISGATDLIYTLAAADAGAKVRVKVTASDGVDSAFALSYSNLVASGLQNLSKPTISGSARQGQTLSATTGSWTSPGTLSYAYQWQSCPSAYRDAVLRDSPVGYWRLGEGAGSNKAADQANADSGDYSATGVTLQAAGALGSDPDTAAIFNGASGLVSMPDTNDLHVADAFTLEGWIRRGGNLGGSQVILSKGPSGFLLLFNAGSNSITLRKAGVADVVSSSVAIIDTTRWHHIVATKNGASAKLYQDGQDVSVAQSSQTFTNSTSGLAIAAYAGGPSDYFQGTIDEVAIYPRALSLAQAQSHYNARSNPTGAACSDIAGATSSSYAIVAGDIDKQLQVKVTATSGSSSLAATSKATVTVADGTPLNTAAPVIGLSAEQNAPPPVLNVGTAVTTKSTGTWEGSSLVYSKQWQSCTGYPSAVLGDAPLGYWRLGEDSGASAADASGNVNNADYTNPPGLGAQGALAGDPDTNAAFDGGQNYLSVPGTYPSGRSPGSIEVWVKGTQAKNESIAGWGDNGAKHAFFLGVSTTGFAHPVIQINGASYDGTTAFSANKWYQLVAVDNGSSLLLYVNGALDSTFSSVDPQMSKGNGAAQIGRFVPAAAAGSYFVGQIDEVSFYASALNLTQVQAHYNAAVAFPGCSDIAGATGSSYTLATADVKKQVRAKVTATNSYGAASGYSALSAIVTSGGPQNTILPALSGSPYETQALTTSKGSWAGDGPFTYAYQWQRCPAYSSTVLADKPFGYWRLGEPTGTTAGDLALAGNGSYLGALPATRGALSGDPDTAVSFDGAGDSVKLPGNYPYPTDRHAASIEAWINGQSFADSQTIAGWGKDPFDNTFPFFLAIGVDGNGAHPEIRTGGTGPWVDTSTTLTPGSWYHLAAVDTGSSLQIFVNGTLKQTFSISGGTRGSGSAWIGSYVPSQSAGSYFNGTIDEVAFYDTSLTSTQLNTHYQAGLATPTCTNISGATSSSYTLAAADDGTQVRSRVTATSSAGSNTASSAFTAPIVTTPPSLDAPSDKGGVHSTTPLLTIATVTGATDYAFQVASDSAFKNIVDSSGWRQTTNTYTVTSAASLTDGHSYYWRGRDRTATASSAWSPGRSFTVRIKRFGTSNAWPIWSHGPIAVNEATGNLILTLPGPAYSTAVGSMGVTLAYNSLDSANRFDLGAGWTISAGDTSANTPSGLIDDSVAGQPGVVDVLWSDGNSSSYNRVADSNVYQPQPGDANTQLKINSDGSGWTLTSGDGTLTTFGAADAGGFANVLSTEVVSAAPGKGALTYTYDVSQGKTRLTRITDPAGRALTLNWATINPTQACNNLQGIVCISDFQASPVTWSFKTDGGNARLGRINDGTRDLVKLSYDASGRVTTIQNANDLDPTNPNTSPNYNGNHALTIVYDAQGRVSTVSDGPTSDQTPSTSTWTFDYHPGTTNTSATTKDHGTLLAGAVRKAAGYTGLTPPNMQGQSKVYYDELDHPMETVDVLGNSTRASYDDKEELLWTEDQDGDPTDYGWDTTNEVLQTATGPDPDGAGPLARPVTKYRYDETAIGSANLAGPALLGLQAAYYANTTLSGRPVLQTDTTVDFNWGTGGPDALNGRSDNFSVRWTANLLAPDSCDYTFSTYSSDGVQLVIDGLNLISNWGTPGVTVPPKSAASKKTRLTQGYHKLVLEYYDGSGPAEVHLRWAYTNCASTIATQIIPKDVLTPAWLNKTSLVSPSGRIAFSHFANPDAGEPDYQLGKLANGTTIITSYGYDTYGRPTQKVMPKGNAGRTIDSNGNLQGTVDLTYATSYTYYPASATATPPAACGGSAADQAQLQKSTSPHGIASTTTIYNSAGQPVAVSNGRGTTCLSYTVEGRLTSQKAPGDTQTTTYTYDPAGAQRTATDAGGTVRTDYDEAGRAAHTIDSFTAEATSTYDADGNPLTRTAKANSTGTNYTTNYTYTARDQLASLTDPAGRQYTFYYCSCGHLKAVQYPNGTFSWLDLNNDKWTTAVYNRHGTITSPPTDTTPVPADSLSSPIADYSYSYSIEGEKTQEVRTGGGLPTETTTYVYDTLGRLSQVTLPSGVIRAYNFDIDSNRTSTVENGSTVSSYTYNPAVTAGLDQLTSVITGGNTTSYTYTADGQVKTRGSDTVTWDGSGRHTGGTFSGTTVAYSFDATGFRRQRVSGSTTTRYVFGGLYETDGTGALTLSAIDGVAGDVAHYAGAPSTSSTVTFEYYNDHGDLAAEADITGARTAAYTYDPFGALRSGSAPSNATSERWVGSHDKKLDSASGLIEMGARAYDGNLGRFLSVDPIEGGSPTIYDYAGQNPVGNYDLDGTCYKGYWISSYDINKEVVGPRAELCRLVDRLHAECLNQSYGPARDDTYCWNWAGQWIHNHRPGDWPGLWQWERLKGDGYPGWCLFTLGVYAYTWGSGSWFAIGLAGVGTIGGCNR